MIKKILSLCLVLAMAFGVTACGESKQTSNGNSSTTTQKTRKFTEAKGMIKYLTIDGKKIPFPETVGEYVSYLEKVGDKIELGNTGKTVDEGTTISLTVSLGSRVTSYSASIPIESPFGRDITDGDGNTDVYDSGQVTVVVYKPDGSSETVYDQNTSEGSLPGSVSTTSTASGSGTVYVYLNGVQVSSYSVDFE